MAFVKVCSLQNRQNGFACTLPCGTTWTVLQAYCLGLGERGGEGLCIT